MSNTYFQFKQFRINQDRCAMKVTTDACILGAWTPLLPGVKEVLDIGTGTGLLSLMLTQRNPGIRIDAVELEKEAREQATENVKNSIWHDRVKVIEADIKEYDSGYKYDLIISNPPFFNNSLLSNNDTDNLARHTLSLSYSELLEVIKYNLSDNGYASVLLPCPEYFQFYELINRIGLYEARKLMIRHNAHSEVKRVITVFGKPKSVESVSCELVIKEDGQNYTAAFKELLAPFYLYL